MEEKEGKGVVPYRTHTLMSIAAKATKVILTNSWHLTYDEMDIVLTLMKDSMEEIRIRSEKTKEEQTCL